MIRKIIISTGITSLGTIFTMVFHFLSLFFITREISVPDFGIYALVITISGFLNLLSSMGLEVSIVKFISEGSQFRENILRPITVLKTLSTIALLIVFIFFYKYYPVDGKIQIWDYNIFTVLIFLLGSYRDYFYRLLQGLNKFVDYTLIQILSALSRLIIILLWINYLEFSLVILFYIEVFVIFFTVILQIIRIPFNSFWRKPDQSITYKYLLKFSLPLFFNNIITFIYDRIGIVVTGALMTTASVAIYDISTRLPGAILGVISSFILVFFPNISTLFSIGDLINAEKLVNQSIKLLTIIISLLTIIIFTWRDEIIIILFSSKYIDASIPLVIMMISLLLRSLANILGYGIVSAGYSRIPMQVNLVSMIIGVISTIVLVYYLGYIGAALSTVILNCVSLIYYAYYYKKLRLIRIDLSFVKSIFILLILLSVCFFTEKIHLNLGLAAIFIFILINLNWFKQFKMVFSSISNNQ